MGSAARPVSAGQAAEARSRLLGEVESEATMLREMQRKQRRDTEMLTDEHLEDAKTLLGLFGVPFIVAPMEAEAQCAALEMEGLVDGVVTEDNDVFLFGARQVYKNLFDPSRHVEYYEMDDIEGELGLGRDQLIELAQLLGSDYTDGVHGVGIVNAMEAVGSFREVGGLRAFGDWARQWDPSRSDAEDGGEAGDASAAVAARLRAFKQRHRNIRRNWVFPDGFPAAQVAEAYLKPSVDKFDGAGCEWARPDLLGLRAFCLHKFGWDQAKADEHLLPVMRAFETTQSQAHIDSYYKFEHRFARYSSDRLRAAVGTAPTPPEASSAVGTSRLAAAPSASAEAEDGPVATAREKRKRRRGGQVAKRAEERSAGGKTVSGALAERLSDASSDDADNMPELRTARGGRGRGRWQARTTR
jgi:DNA excision repair protein ERCC-5